MKKLLIVLAVLTMAISTIGCKSIPTNFNMWGSITKNSEVLEKACGGFTEWTESTHKLETTYVTDLVQGNDSMVVTATVTPTVQVDEKYLVIMRTDSTSGTTNTDKFIVTAGDSLITGEERAQAIKKAVEKLGGITGIIFTMSARANFINFGQIQVNEASISCQPQIIE